MKEITINGKTRKNTSFQYEDGSANLYAFEHKDTMKGEILVPFHATEFIRYTENITQDTKPDPYFCESGGGSMSFTVTLNAYSDEDFDYINGTIDGYTPQIGDVITVSITSQEYGEWTQTYTLTTECSWGDSTVLQSMDCSGSIDGNIRMLGSILTIGGSFSNRVPWGDNTAEITVVR